MKTEQKIREEVIHDFEQTYCHWTKAEEDEEVEKRLQEQEKSG